jgi:putative FmdB family regulatory protein
MPRYDYVCRDCGQRFTIRLSMAAYAEGGHPPCSDCGSTNVERAFSALNVLTGSRAGHGASGGGCGPTGFR